MLAKQPRHWGILVGGSLTSSLDLFPFTYSYFHSLLHYYMLHLFYFPFLLSFQLLLCSVEFYAHGAIHSCADVLSFSCTASVDAVLSAN